MQCFCEKSVSRENKKNIIKSAYDMINMEEAYIRIRNHFTNSNTSKSVTINISSINAEDYISSESVFSMRNVPNYDTSMMDGYAINIEKCTPNEVFNVVEKLYVNSYTETAAENVLSCRHSNDCVYLTTGSIVPSCFDSVIPIEYFEQIDNKSIKLLDEYIDYIHKGSFIRRTASDITKGEQVIAQNSIITLSDISVLASIAVKYINAYRLPRVGVLSTGDEITDLDKEGNEEVESNKIVDTNRITLIKLLHQTFPDLQVIDYGIVKDDIDVLLNKFQLVIQDKCDILITSGGVSMGEKDLVKILLEKKGKIIFGRLNMKPGKPTTFGIFPGSTTGEHLTVFGLPGNPVSCAVCFYLIIPYAIRMFQNPSIDIPYYKTISALILHDIKLDPERPEYSRGILYLYSKDNIFIVHTTGNQQSSRLKSLQQFNCLICLPKGANESNLITKAMKVNCIIIRMFEVLDDNSYLIMNNKYADKYTKEKINNDTKINQNNKISVATITISDRAFIRQDKYDKTTAVLKSYFESRKNLYELKEQMIVSDDRNEILKAYKHYVEEGYNLIITSGGTGLSPRDVTEEVTRNFVDKEAKSISTYIITESIKITKFACLSNPVVGVKGKSLIVTLPGSPKAVEENMQIIEDILPHALNQVSVIKDFH